MDEEEELEERAEEERLHREERLFGEQRQQKDFWEVDDGAKKLRRHHVKKRKGAFNPSGSKDIPFGVALLGGSRKSVKKLVNKDHDEVQIEDRWRSKSITGEWNDWWCGFTEFEIEDEKAFEVWVAGRKGQDDVDLTKESAEDLEEWKVQDAAEWFKVAGSGAVEVLSEEESRKIRKSLQDQGKEDRILPTKIARRYKPAEQPGEPASKKSRLCIRGDLDPDLLELERFSPTINTVNLSLLLQIAANEGMVATVGDLKNAFCQSRPLKRKNGELYFQQPKEGIQGLHQDQIVRIINGCYGLVDAPLHWRKSLIAELESLGYRPSRMDPCIFVLYSEETKKLTGAIAIEVDDLFTVGTAEHHRKMEELQRKFTFGKYMKLKDEAKGASFNGRRIRQEASGEFKVDMQKFIQERLKKVELKKGRASDKKAEADEEEIAQSRAVCGALNWLSKEGRPDAAGPSSLLSSKLTTLKIEDILMMNETVKRLQESSQLTLRIQPLRSMKFSIVTDASFGNNGFHSQGGHVVLAHEAGLREGEKVRANVLAWRSGKLQRVVNSTLAAETQSLSKGMGDLLWMMVLYQELTDPKFEMKKWKETLSAKEILVLAAEESQQVLKESLAIVDAKSLYGYLAKETVGGQDRRTAIEIQIIREDLLELRGQVRWIDHPAMVADCLTKVKGNIEPLHHLIQNGTFCIKAENERMKVREEARNDGQSSSNMRRFGVKENIGSCDFSELDHTMD